MLKPIIFTAAVLCFGSPTRGAEPPLAIAATTATEVLLDQQFHGAVRPFVETYCLSCHGPDKPEGELDLSPFQTTGAVIAGFGHWELVLERLEAAEMPPSKPKNRPTRSATRSPRGSTRCARMNPPGTPATPGPCSHAD